MLALYSRNMLCTTLEYSIFRIFARAYFAPERATQEWRDCGFRRKSREPARGSAQGRFSSPIGRKRIAHGVSRGNETCAEEPPGGGGRCNRVRRITPARGRPAPALGRRWGNRPS